MSIPLLIHKKITWLTPEELYEFIFKPLNAISPETEQLVGIGVAVVGGVLVVGGLIIVLDGMIRERNNRNNPPQPPQESA